MLCTISDSFQVLSHFISTVTLWRQYYYLHVRDKGVSLIEVEWLDHSHMTAKGQNPDFNLWFSEIKTHTPPSALCHLHVTRKINYFYWIIFIELGSYMIPLNLHKHSFDVNFICISEKDFFKPLLYRMMVIHQSMGLKKSNKQSKLKMSNKMSLE